MGDDYSRIDLGKLARLTEAGQLYQAADSVAATTLVAANFLFWSGSSKGLAVRLISARVIASLPLAATFGTVLADPELTPGNGAVNLRLGGGSAQAFDEAQAVAATTITEILGVPQLIAGTEVELLSPGGIYLPPNSGVAIVSALVAATVSVVWLWAEVPV